MKEIKLNGGFIALVDDEDYERILPYTWYAIKKGRCVYAMRSIFKNWHRSATTMHRQILNISETKTFIDHKDFNALNNQKSNLRICTSKQNAWNRRKRIDTPNKYKGVHTTKYGKFSVILNIDGINKHIGNYDDEKEAALAYNVAASFSRGKFAYLNTI